MSTANYTCNTCGLGFGSGEFQREHMKTEWHRYNLKRRVAELPPIPADVFAQKVMAAQEQQNQQPVSRRQVTKKDLKREQREQRRQQHLQTQVSDMTMGDRANSLSSVDFSAGEPSREFMTSSDVSTESENEETSVPMRRDSSSSNSSDSSRKVPQDDVDRLLQQKLKTYVRIPPNVSFMDGHESASVADNVAYLGAKYGLVIPEEDHVADWDGLVSYFNEKVGLGNCCLSCGYMGRTLAAARAHMLDKQHVKVPWDTDEEQAEILDFYDFEYEDSSDENEWEDLDDAAADDDATDATESEFSESDTTDTEDNGVRGSAKSDYDQFADMAIVNGYELILGTSGRSAGHRSLNRYFKQRAVAPADKPGRKAVRLVDYRSPGVTERAADKMVKKAWQEEKKAADKFNRGRKQQNYQQHFRDPLLQ